jgi:ABC-type bacteriocin/lantibiotic exporter with double-glycine peptidase domain
MGDHLMSLQRILYVLVAIVSTCLFCGLAAKLERRNNRFIDTQQQADNLQKSVQIYSPNNPCGPMSVALASAILHEQTSNQRIREVVFADTDGFSTAQDIYLGLQRLGYYPAVIHTSDIGLFNKEFGPIILHTLSGHYVVSLITNNSTAVLIDAYGASVRKFQDVNAICSGIVITIHRSIEERRVALAKFGVSDDPD